MSLEEVNDITAWLTDEIMNLPVDEQVVIFMAQVQMCKSIKPIYDKHKKQEGKPVVLRLDNF